VLAGKVARVQSVAYVHGTFARQRRERRRADDDISAAGTPFLRRRCVRCIDIEALTRAYLLYVMSMSFIFILHWPQLLALFGAGPEDARFHVELKRAPLPLPYLVSLLTAILLLELLPYVEEWWRGWRSRHVRPSAPGVHVDVPVGGAKG
jgi:hypothetical protein